jgi:hypothetical protein
MAFPWRNGIFLLDFTPIVVGFCEFELKEVISELNKGEKGRELPSG